MVKAEESLEWSEELVGGEWTETYDIDDPLSVVHS